MSKQLITVALFAGIFLMAAPFTNAQTAQKKTEQKGIKRAPEKNDNEKSRQLKIFARPPRSARSMSDDHLVPCDDY
jgi:hypothetical protein